MHLTSIATSPCNLCGKGNTPRNDGQENVFVDLERDINWNDPLILCEDCATKVGAIVGMLGPDEKSAFEQQLIDKDRELHELQSEIDGIRRQITEKRKAKAAA